MKFCPNCGKQMTNKQKVSECPSCGYIYVKENEGNSAKFDKVVDGVGNIGEQVFNQVKKEEAYIKARLNNDSTALVDENEFFISKYVLDGADFVNTKKQERNEAKKEKRARKEEEKEEKKVKKEEEKIKRGEEKIKRGEEKVKEEAKNRPENALFYIDGREGTLAIFDEYIQLDFTGSALKQYLSRMGGVKKIYYPQINSIQKRDAGNIVLGSIEFEVPGMSYSGRGGGKSENIIHYEYYYQDEADKIYEFVNQKILNIQNSTVNTQSTTSNESNTLSELKKAKELLDMGAISQEEFDNIKKELLN